MYYSKLEDLPHGMQRRIIDFQGDRASEWVNLPIPGMGGYSVIELMNTQDGEEKVLQILTKIEGHFK